MPRKLEKNDAAFDWPELRNGLRNRAEDEVKLLSLQTEVQKKPLTAKDMVRLANQIAETAYGKGVTAEMRQKYLLKYGCTAWTKDVIEELVAVGSGRGFVEIGCGNGQWARKISETFLAKDQTSMNNDFEIVLAFDDYSAVPINPNAFGGRSKSNEAIKEYFYSNVQVGDQNTAFGLNNQVTPAYGRVLLLIFPGPDDMAIKSLQKYVNQGQKNDYLVYVGEGRGGANANEEFFDFLENQNWVLENVFGLDPIGNGFERAFFFRRFK